MLKGLFIVCIILFSSGNLFSQVASAYASATIITPVGAEISGEINDKSFSEKHTGEEAIGINIKGYRKTDLSFLKIIGAVFSHHVIIENDVIIKQKRIMNDQIAEGWQTSFVSVTIIFD